MIDFSRPANIVAPKLLGCTLTHGGVSIVLTEVEAYLGEEDAGAHTYRGKTARNAAMFGPPGHFYVYLSYGIHHNVNIVCAPEGIGQGCLLRGGRVIEGHDIAYRRRQKPDRLPIEEDNLARGPGNLGEALGFELTDNHKSVSLTAPTAPPEWVCGPRIGISKNADAPWRFWIPGDKTVSTPRGYKTSNKYKA